MNTRHEQEKKQFRDLFTDEGIDKFDKRFKILEAFLSIEDHVTTEDIVERLKQDKTFMELDFVEETMELLCRFGFASRLKIDHGPVRYEHKHLGLHHDHMVCTKCSRIIEFRDEALEKQQVQLAAAYGFHMLQHKMMIYGICSDCMQKRDLVMSLARAKQGEHLEIESFSGGRQAKMRLASMGLRPGDIIDVVSTQGGGQSVISSGDRRFVIGQGLAQKVMVKYAGTDSADGREAGSDLHRICPNQSRETLIGRHSCPCKKKFLLNIDKKTAPLQSMRLSEMKQGQEGIIARVGGHGILRRRLLEMGINRGTKVHVEKYAPLKDPLEIIIKGYHVSLRVEEASHIIIENIVQGG